MILLKFIKKEIKLIKKAKKMQKIYIKMSIKVITENLNLNLKIL